MEPARRLRPSLPPAGAPGLLRAGRRPSRRVGWPSMPRSRSRPSRPLSARWSRSGSSRARKPRRVMWLEPGDPSLNTRHDLTGGSATCQVVRPAQSSKSSPLAAPPPPRSGISFSMSSGFSPASSRSTTSSNSAGMSSPISLPMRRIMRATERGSFSSTPPHSPGSESEFDPGLFRAGKAHVPNAAFQPAAAAVGAGDRARGRSLRSAGRSRPVCGNRGSGNRTSASPSPCTGLY